MVGPAKDKHQIHQPTSENLSSWSSLSLGRIFKSKKEGKDQESRQSSTTPDPGYHPLYTGNPIFGTLANSVNPDEMQQYVAFH